MASSVSVNAVLVATTRKIGKSDLLRTNYTAGPRVAPTIRPTRLDWRKSVDVARHTLSTEGRLRCAAAGSANLQAWRNGEQLPSDIEREAEDIRAQLEERATMRAEPARGLLIRSAVAQFTKLCLIQRQLLRTSRLSAKAPLGGDVISRR